MIKNDNILSVGVSVFLRSCIRSRTNLSRLLSTQGTEDMTRVQRVLSLTKNDINLNVALAFGRYVERNCPDVKVI